MLTVTCEILVLVLDGAAARNAWQVSLSANGRSACAKSSQSASWCNVSSVAMADARALVSKSRKYCAKFFLQLVHAKF